MTREGADSAIPSLTVRFNEQVFSESEIREILDTARPFTQVHASKEYSFSFELDIALTIVLGLSAFYFSRGFFTKIGEKLGDEVGDDAVRAYRALKKVVAESLRRKAKDKKGALRFELIPDGSSLEVHAKVESSSTNDLEGTFDSVQELSSTAKKDAQELNKATGEEIVRVHYRYDTARKLWVMTYALSRAHRVLAFEET